MKMFRLIQPWTDKIEKETVVEISREQMLEDIHEYDPEFDVDCSDDTLVKEWIDSLIDNGMFLDDIANHSIQEVEYEKTWVGDVEVSYTYDDTSS